MVELTEGQACGELTEPLPCHASSTQMCPPHDSLKGNTTEELRVESEPPMTGHIGMDTCNDRVFDSVMVFTSLLICDLCTRGLTQAEMSLLSKGLSFCPTPREIDMFALRKDMFDYIRRLHLKEYYCGDIDVDGTFQRETEIRYYKLM